MKSEKVTTKTRSSFENSIALEKDKTTMDKNNENRTNGLETWINNTLAECEALDIPGILIKPSGKKPLARYQLDILHLSGKEKVSLEDCQRIYNSLFVYSFGFYQMIQDVVKHSPNPMTLTASIWKVFAVLLEFCNHKDYRQILQKNQIDHLGEIAKVEDLQKSEALRIKDVEDALRTKVFDLEKHQTELEIQNSNYKEEIAMLTKKLKDSVQTAEREVYKRKGFESNATGLQALQRDTDAKYKRACADILDLTIGLQERDELKHKHEDEL